MPKYRELFADRVGEGPPLLLMHGGPGFDHTGFRPWLDELAGTFALIYYDHRGNGRSVRPADWSEVTHESWAADADWLMRDLGHERFFLFGHSYGGFLALEYALRYQDRLLGLILCSTAPALDYPEVIAANAQARGTEDQVAALGEAFAGPTPDDATFERLVWRIAPLYFHNPDAGMVEAVFGRMRFSAGAFNRAFFGCLQDYNMVGKLRKLSVPTLIVSGDDDYIAPPAQGRDRFLAELPHAQAAVIPDAGHFPFAEQPSLFREIMLSWVDEVQALRATQGADHAPPLAR